MFWSHGPVPDPSRFLIHWDVSVLLQPLHLVGFGTERSALVGFDDLSSLRRAVLDRLDRAADVLDIDLGVRRGPSGQEPEALASGSRIRRPSATGGQAPALTLSPLVIRAWSAEASLRLQDLPRAPSLQAVAGYRRDIGTGSTEKLNMAVPPFPSAPMRRWSHQQPVTVLTTGNV
jgi:hypothetical protein